MSVRNWFEDDYGLRPWVLVLGTFVAMGVLVVGLTILLGESEVEWLERDGKPCVVVDGEVHCRE